MSDDPKTSIHTVDMESAVQIQTSDSSDASCVPGNVVLSLPSIKEYNSHENGKTHDTSSCEKSIKSDNESPYIDKKIIDKNVINPNNEHIIETALDEDSSTEDEKRLIDNAPINPNDGLISNNYALKLNVASEVNDIDLALVKNSQLVMKNEEIDIETIQEKYTDDISITERNYSMLDVASSHNMNEIVEENIDCLPDDSDPSKEINSNEIKNLNVNVASVKMDKSVENFTENEIFTNDLLREKLGNNMEELNLNTLLEAEKILIDLKILQLTKEMCNLEEKDIKSNTTVEEIKRLNKFGLSRNIGQSTNSLNDNDIAIEKSHTAINRSPLSKSAENLSCLQESSGNDEEINTNKILADFENQKRKVSLPQNVPTNEVALQEQKYPRSHKDVITQDFGSMFKNVHGIFSTVSGSLKHAYNISQRMPAQQININKLLTSGSLKNTANGKIMNTIFDTGDQVNVNKMIAVTQEATVRNSNVASPQKQNISGETPNLDMNMEFSITEEDKIESLEKSLLNERIEMATLKEKVRQQAEELAEKERDRKEMDNKMEMLRKRLDEAIREKDNAVMRYAVSERGVIGARNAADAAKRAERATRAEAELLVGKLKSAHSEKQRICQIYDDKCHELATSERETARLREEVKEYEGKLKWTQSKLRTEVEAYREAASSVEKLSAQVTELEAARDAAITSAGDALRTRQLESELKEARASLILRRHDNEELEKRLTSCSQQLDSCQTRLTDATAAVSRLEKQVSSLTADNRQLGEEAAELASLRARAALADTLTQQLQRETERATQAEEETSRERARAETCARREAAALEHAARLTAEHVGEKALLRQQENAARALGADNASLRERLSALEVQVTEAQAALAQETSRRANECRLLARKVAELTEELDEANRQLEWEKGENSVLRKKHASAVKELNRELQRTLKRCEQLEARASEPPEASTPTGSVSSLSSMEAPSNGEERKVNGHTRNDSAPDVQVREPDRQALIERIVQLQRAGARRAERCDFLEEHSRQLTAELRNKTRLLRELVASQPSGALAGNSSDEHKREMARLGGGAMAAVWGGNMDGMTLPLSLEMNRKLQAVLEDALLKNITLKKNMDTLGEEIARLKSQVKENT